MTLIVSRKRNAKDLQALKVRPLLVFFQLKRKRDTKFIIGEHHHVVCPVIDHKVDVPLTLHRGKSVMPEENQFGLGAFWYIVLHAEPVLKFPELFREPGPPRS